MFSRAGKVRGSMAAPAASTGKGAAEAPRSGLSPPCGPQTVLETVPLSALRDVGTTCQHRVLETPICERNPGTPATTAGHLWEKPGHRWDDTRPGGRETQAHTPCPPTSVRHCEERASESAFRHLFWRYLRRRRHSFQPFRRPPAPPSSVCKRGTTGPAAICS